MLRRHTRRPGFRLVELLAVVFIVVIVLGLLIPSRQRFHHDYGARSQSQNNLKQMGLAMHNQASVRKGKVWVGAVASEDGKGGFFVQLLPFMDWQTIYDNIGGSVPPYPAVRSYYAPLDTFNDATQPGLSYGLNGYLVNLGTTRGGDFQPVEEGGVDNGVVFIPTTFNKRGLSNVVGIAERSANHKRTYYGPDVYFSPPFISQLPTASAGATAFSAVATQVTMMDGSVRGVAPTLGGKVCGDNSAFDIACSLNREEALPANW